MWIKSTVGSSRPFCTLPAYISVSNSRCQWTQTCITMGLPFCWVCPWCGWDWSYTVTSSGALHHLLPTNRFGSHSPNETPVISLWAFLFNIDLELEDLIVFFWRSPRAYIFKALTQHHSFFQNIAYFKLFHN